MKYSCLSPKHNIFVGKKLLSLRKRSKLVTKTIHKKCTKSSLIQAHLGERFSRSGPVNSSKLTNLCPQYSQVKVSRTQQFTGSRKQLIKTEFIYLFILFYFIFLFFIFFCLFFFFIYVIIFRSSVCAPCCLKTLLKAFSKSEYIFYFIQNNFIFFVEPGS